MKDKINKMENKMKKIGISLSLAAIVALNPIGLSAADMVQTASSISLESKPTDIVNNNKLVSNSIWKTDQIYVYKTPFVNSEKKKLNSYKKYDSYYLIACDKNEWCLSYDGYVKKFLFKILADDIPIVNNIEKLRIEIDSMETFTDNSVALEKETIIEEVNQTIISTITTNEQNVFKISDYSNETLNTISSKVDNEKAEGVNSSYTIDLSIEKLIKEVIKRNPNILFDRLQGDIIDKQISYEDNILTPQFYLNLNHQDLTNPNNTETTLSKGYLSTSTEVSNNIEMGLTGLLPSGAKWNASIKSNDKKSNLIELHKEYESEYDDSFSVSVNQPLMRGFGADITKSKYHLALADKDIFKKQYKKKLTDIIGGAIQTYWKYYGTLQLQKTWKKSLELNKLTLNLLEEKAKSGDIAYIEVLETKSAYMSRKAEFKKVSSESIKMKNEILSLLNISINNNKDIEFNLVDVIDTKIDSHKILEKRIVANIRTKRYTHMTNELVSLKDSVNTFFKKPLYNALKDKNKLSIKSKIIDRISYYQSLNDSNSNKGTIALHSKIDNNLNKLKNDIEYILKSVVYGEIIERDTTNINAYILTLINKSIKSYSAKESSLVYVPTPFIGSEKYYQMALKNWPELAIAKEKLKKEQLQIKLAKDSTRAKLDFVASAYTTTLSDKRENQFYEKDFLTWNIGLQYSIPIFNTQGNSVLKMAKIKKNQVALEIKTLDNGLNNALSTKIALFNNSKQQVAFYQEGLSIKEELHRYSQKAFNIGEKNIRDVLIQEEDIINYKRKLYGAIIDWKLSEASLDKAVGILFDKYISLDEINSMKSIQLDEKLNNDNFGKM